MSSTPTVGWSVGWTVGWADGWADGPAGKHPGWVVDQLGGPHPLPPSVWDFDSSRWPAQDLVAAGADLEPATIVEAYRSGVFPMPHHGELLWWSPMRRGVLEPGSLHVSRSLRRSARRFTVTIDTAFDEVIDGCAAPDRPGAWIDESIRVAYRRLHRLGWAHSIEVRDGAGELAGGLYGLAVGGLFAGESMFHRATDASKVALLALAEHVRPRLVDVQWRTPHLASLGVVEWSRERYLAALPDLVGAPDSFATAAGPGSRGVAW